MKTKHAVAAFLLGGSLGCGVPETDTSTADSVISDEKSITYAATTTPPVFMPVSMIEESLNIPRTVAPTIPRSPVVRQVPRAAALSDAQVAQWDLPPIRAAGIVVENGVLKIVGTSANDTASVEADASGLNVIARIGRITQTFSRRGISSVTFSGEAGDDTFTNSTSLKSTINGGDGNDTLNGGSGNDFIVGGYGQDTIHGNGGNDTIWGSGGSDFLYGDDGDDEIFGHGGSDQIHGGAGRDTINGGSSNDTIWGDSGQDLIVTVGGGVDTIYGGSQWDNFWVDTSDSITDSSTDEQNLGYVHKISSYRNGASLEATGENIADPAKYASHTATLADYSDHPLFAAAGPNKDDIFQGSVGDCYFVARLSAIAKQDPEYIRKLVAPLGDGSYAVRFYRNGSPDYVRVDSDLWQNGGNLKYADVGQDGALWVPIVEKAFAIARRDQNSYESINGGSGTTLSSMKEVKVGSAISDGLTEATTNAWFQAGEQPGTTLNTMTGSVQFLLYAINSQLNAGEILVTGAMAQIGDGTAIRMDNPNTSTDESTYRRGEHIYAVDRVNFANGVPVSLTLRDPWGLERTIEDVTRLHYCIGRFSTLTMTY